MSHNNIEFQPPTESKTAFNEVETSTKLMEDLVGGIRRCRSREKQIRFLEGKFPGQK